MAETPLPMFPLGTVLYPHVAIGLHLFEPRYRALGRDLQAGDGRFGVVLIDQGSEVGGGETRRMIGTKARVTEALELPDGRWQMIARGEHRIQVKAWLPDDPYPLALVEELPDVVAGAEPVEDLLDSAEKQVRRALALKAELNEPAQSSGVPISRDPVRAGYELAAVAPVGPFDHQRLLEAGSPLARLTLVAELSSSAADDFVRRLGTGG